MAALLETIHPRMRVMELPVEGASASIVVTFQDFHNGSSYRNLRSPRDKATWLHNALNSDGHIKRDALLILINEDRIDCARIKTEYRTMYAEDLVQRCTAECDSHNLRDLVELRLQYTLPECHANTIHEALRANPPNVKAATQTICSLTKDDMEETKGAYYNLFDASLEDDVQERTIGVDRDLLLSRLSSRRIGSLSIDEEMLDGRLVAGELYEAFGNIYKTPQKTLINKFTGLPEEHLAAVSSDYQDLYKMSLKKDLKHVTSGNFMHGLATILECSQNRPKYFAKLLHKALKDPEQVDHETIRRVIVTRAESDINDIKNEYLKEYGRTLDKAVYSVTSGDYRKALLLLLNRP